MKANSQTYYAVCTLEGYLAYESGGITYTDDLSRMRLFPTNDAQLIQGVVKAFDQAREQHKHAEIHRVHVEYADATEEVMSRARGDIKKQALDKLSRSEKDALGITDTRDQ